MVIFPLAPYQTIAQMWSSGARGETGSGTGCFIAVPIWQQWRQTVNLR